MSVHIGGKDSYKQVVKGDVVMSLQWINDEPAMVIWPKVRRTLSNGAYCICLSSAYKYADNNYLIQQAAICAEYIGLEKSAFAIRNIADVILNHLQDLCEMPPEQMVRKKEKSPIIGDLSVIVDGQTVREIEVPEAVA